jgi:FG-GAP repeat
MRTIQIGCAWLLLTLLSAASSANEKPVSRLSDLPDEAQSSISATLGRDLPEYCAKAAGEDFVTENPQQHLSAQFGVGGVRVRQGSASWATSVSAYGYGDRLHTVPSTVPIAQQNRVEYRRGPLTEWYVNGPAGLEQGFSLSRRPEGQSMQPLTIALAMSGDMKATLGADKASLTLTGSQKEIVYTALSARDSAGSELPVWLDLEKDQLLLRMDDRKAHYPVVIDPTLKQARLTASDEINGGLFGYSVAISGNTLVVGSPEAYVGSVEQGAAYVFVKPTGGWSNLTENAKLVAPDGHQSDEFGHSVAISGNQIAVGAPDYSGSQTNLVGSAYFFREPTLGWSGTITGISLGTGHSNGAEFGSSVGVSGNIVIVGAPYENAAYLMVCSTNFPTCGLDATFYGVAGPEPQFGTAVAISGTTFVVTDPYATVGANQFQGAAYVFTYRPPNSFDKATLTASDGAFLDEMGISVAMTNNTVVVGCPFFGATTFFAPGAAYVYTKPANGWADATQTAKLTASDAANTDYFGMGVAVSGGVVAVGAPNKQLVKYQQGAAYVYIEPFGGWRDQTENIELIASDGAQGDYFGNSVSTNGVSVVVGAPYGKNTNLNLADGTTYVYNH